MIQIYAHIVRKVNELQIFNQVIFLITLQKLPDCHKLIFSSLIYFLIIHLDLGFQQIFNLIISVKIICNPQTMKQELNRILKSDLTSYDSIVQQKISNIDHINDCLTQRSRFINSFQQMLKKQMDKIVTKEQISQQLNEGDNLETQINTTKDYQHILKQLLYQNIHVQKIQITAKKDFMQRQTSIVSKSCLVENEHNQSFLDFFQDAHQKVVPNSFERQKLSNTLGKENKFSPIYNPIQKCQKNHKLKHKVKSDCIDSISMLRQQNIKMKQFFALEVDKLGQFICEIFTEVMNQIVNKITEIYEHRIQKITNEKLQLNQSIYKLIQQLQTLKAVINETPRMATKPSELQQLTFKNKIEQVNIAQRQVQLPLKKQQFQNSLSLSRFLKNLTISDTNFSKVKSIRGIKCCNQKQQDQQRIKNIKIDLQMQKNLKINNITPINKGKNLDLLNSEEDRIKQSYQQSSLQFSRSHIKKLFSSNENSKIVDHSQMVKPITDIQSHSKENQKNCSETKWKQYVYDITGKKNQVRSVYQDTSLNKSENLKLKEIQPKIPFLLKIANGKSYDIPNISPFKNFIPPLKTGYSTLKIADKIIYKGMWQNTTFHGRGKLSLKQYTYEGQFKNGKFQGNGTLSIGQIQIQGNFKNNKVHGEATLKMGTKTIVGQWIQNKFIRQY